MGAEGWVKNYRKIEDWEWYRTPNMAHLFQHLIRNANHKDGRWQGVEIKKGQLICGLPSLSAATGISIQSLRTCLARLESSGEISRKSTNRFSVITVCKYEAYQQEDIDSQQASNRQATGKQQATNNKQECKNERMEEERKDIVGQDARPRQNGVPVAAIVEMLNAKAGTQFKPTADVTKRHIKARWAEGFTIDDFRVVVEHKVSEWGTDAKMREFLRPQTLFGTKFESYLQAAKMAPVELNQWGIYGKWKDQPQHN